MARARDFLERFRPSGTPGAAARPGVPADRLAERSAELEPLLALLADAEAEAAQIRAAAQQGADLRQREGQDRARAVLAAGRRQVVADRAEIVAQAQRQGAAEVAAVRAAAEAEAEAIRTRVEQRMPALVERVVSAVGADLAAVIAAHQEDRPATQEPP
jgi:F0F1-type ATP synthase membrane subunit b/b'